MPHKDPEQRRAFQEAYREKHRDKLRAHASVYNNTPERKALVKEYQKDWYATPSIRMRTLALAAKTRSNERGIAFEEALIEHLMKAPPTACDCCGKDLDYSAKSGRKDRSPSLDRFNNDEGYAIANVRIVCWRCNMLKKDATIQEIKTVIAYMRGEGRP